MKRLTISTVASSGW